MIPVFKELNLFREARHRHETQKWHRTNLMQVLALIEDMGEWTYLLIRHEEWGNLKKEENDSWR